MQPKPLGNLEKRIREEKERDSLIKEKIPVPTDALQKKQEDEETIDAKKKKRPVFPAPYDLFPRQSDTEHDTDKECVEKRAFAEHPREILGEIVKERPLRCA